MGEEEESDGRIYNMLLSFPSSSSKESNLTSNIFHKDNNQRKESIEEFVFVYDEDKRPVIVLLGWAGCQARYLAKYSAIYQEKSCITLSYTTPVDCLFWQKDKMPLIAERLVDVISKNNLEEHPIFFHIFSNGGAFLYQHVSLVIQQSHPPLKVKGVIFDSAPGQKRLTTLFKAIRAMVGGHPLTNIPISFAITLFLSILWLFELIVEHFGYENRIQTNPMNLAEENHSWPQLFLYSNTDDLIPASDVEQFATRRAERGVRVQLVLFMDSPHVKHYAIYREAYVNIICSFLHECLNSNSKDSNEMSGLNLTRRVVLPEEAST